MKKALLAASAASCVMLSGCGATLMRDAPSQEVARAGGGKAKVVFMRSSMVGGAVGCELFEVVNGELRLIGQLPTGNKVAYETTPGKKVFMAYGMSADFMLAELEAGRTYYSIVRPNWGTSGFAPTPVRAGELKSSETEGMMKGTKLIEVDAKAADAWMGENKQRMQGIYAEYWDRFQRKSSQEKLERTLLPKDGQ
jgi:hypothetical protein